MMTLFVLAVDVRLGLSGAPVRRLVSRLDDRNSEAVVVGGMGSVLVEDRCGHLFRCSVQTWCMIMSSESRRELW